MKEYNFQAINPYQNQRKSINNWDTKKSEKEVVRCWECGSPNVVAVCHHCGRYLCAEHSYYLSPDPEFKKIPGLTKTAHCREHYHPPIYPIIPTFIGILFILFEFITNSYIYIVLASLFFILSFFEYYSFNIKKTNRIKNKRINKRILPLIPDIKVYALENVQYDYNIGSPNKTYVTEKDKKGNIFITNVLSKKEERRYALFSKLYRMTVNWWDFGYIAIDNTEKVKILKSPYSIRNGLIHILEPRRNNFKELCRKLIPLNSKIEYNIVNNSKTEKEYDERPLRILADITSGGNGSVLELKVVLNKIGGDQPINATMRDFSIVVPASLEDIEEIKIRQNYTEKDRGRFDEKTNRIVWRDVTLPIELKNSPRYAPPTYFIVKFKNAVKSADMIEGSYELHINNFLISSMDIRENRIWTAVGLKQKAQTQSQLQYGDEISGERGIDVRKLTVLSGQFNIDTSSLTIPGQHTKTFTVVQKGLIPDHFTVSRIIKTLNDKGIYVKSMIETPATVSKTRANIKNRYWDILGRKYDDVKGIYGMDVHAVLSGEEAYGKGPIPVSGTSRLEITVRGSTRTDVDYVKDNIDSFSKELNEGISHSLKTYLHPYKHKRETTIDVDQIGKIESKMEKLEDALLEGNISEEKYEHMMEKYKKELHTLKKELKLEGEDEVDDYAE